MAHCDWEGISWAAAARRAARHLELIPGAPASGRRDADAVVYGRSQPEHTSEGHEFDNAHASSGRFNKKKGTVLPLLYAG